VRSHKTQLRLAELLRPDGSLGLEGTKVLVHAAQEARAAAEDEGVEDLVAFATSAVARPPTRPPSCRPCATTPASTCASCRRGRGPADVPRVRRWFGWSAGRLLCLDIGGGSLELAAASTRSRRWRCRCRSAPAGSPATGCPGDPPRKKDVEAVRAYAREQVEGVADSCWPAASRPGRRHEQDLPLAGAPDGAAPYDQGPRVPRRLRRSGLAKQVEKLQTMTCADRAQCPVSRRAAPPAARRRGRRATALEARAGRVSV
jgi:exopolyphosphatase/guanosine-5'-triphosphate,3'-diphosphate pyrophosphatase